MSRAQVAVMEEQLYVGGGYILDHEYDYKYRVLLYSKTEDKWSDLPHCTVGLFGFAQYTNTLITVGGIVQHRSLTAKVFTLSADFRRWEERIPPMPTARYSLSVITTTKSHHCSWRSVKWWNVFC